MAEDSSEAALKYGFNLAFLRRVWRAQALLFPSLFSLNSLLFILLLVLSFLEQYLAYLVGLIAGKYYKVHVVVLAIVLYRTINCISPGAGRRRR